MATKRKYLCGHRSRGKIQIDMEDVYKKIDKGMTRQQVAEELDVSVNTLYRRHHEWQTQIEVLGEDFDKEDFYDEDVLPLPPGEEL